MNRVLIFSAIAVLVACAENDVDKLHRLRAEMARASTSIRAIDDTARDATDRWAAARRTNDTMQSLRDSLEVARLQRERQQRVERFIIARRGVRELLDCDRSEVKDVVADCLP